MATLLDEIVITEGNREAFESILTIGRNEDAPRRLFVWGPVGSGKSSVVQARGRERDLLSTRQIISCHGQEIIAILKSGVNDEFLNKIGEVDILLLDGFESLFDDEVGVEVARLLLAARNQKGLETVVVSDVPSTDLDVESLKGALDGFTEIEVKPLDNDGRVDFARKIQASMRRGNDKAPSLDEDALRYIAIDFSQSPGDIRNAITFLLRETEQSDGAVIGLEEAVKLLSQ